MANNVKFSTGLQDDLLKRNSDNSYVHKIENGHVYFATRENDEGETIGSIFYDVNGKRVSMGGGVAEQAKADDMKQNIADTYVTRISSEGAKYASTDGVTLTTYNGRNAVLDTILLPVAGTDRAGVVITGAQTFAGNKTFTGIIHLTNTRDAESGSDSGVLIIGNKDGSHLIFGDNEIMAKNKIDGTGVLYLNADGGTVYIGGNFLPNGTTKTLSLGSATAYWKEAYIGNVVTDTLSGHLTGSLTGNVTGNVTGHASLDLPLAGGTMTGDISFATIASWPTASGETYPIKSKGLKWSGSSDNASIYYVVEASDKGALYLDMGDDAGTAIKFAMGGTAHTVFESNGNIYPATTNKGSLGTSDNKFASVYATNFYGIIDKAYGDESGNNIQASYGAKLQAHTHDGSGWSFRLLNKNGGVLADTLTVPEASDTLAGLMTVNAQTFAGKKTFTGQVVVTGGSDTSKGTANSGQLIVGDPAAEHLAIDGNEIMAKASGTTVRALLFQLDGGDTKFGGNVNPYATNVHSLGTEDLAWKEAHIGEIYGHLNGSVTGTLSGNASSASKWLTGRTLTIGSKGKVVDGTADVSWSRAEIGISRNFTSFKTASANTDGWYTIATIADSTTSPAIFLVRGYAHSSIVFTVTKGYSTDGSVNILDYNASRNDGYAYVKGARLLKDGKVQIQIHTKTTAGATTAVNMHVNAFNSSDTLTLSDSLVADDSASPEVIQTREPAATGVMMANRFYGALYGTADKATNDTSGAAILDKYITRVDFAQADTSDSDKTQKLNIRLYDGNNALKATVQVPNASTTTAGVVNTGTQSFAGNKTFTGRIHFSNTTDAAKASDSGVITIGDKSGEHMLLDNNEIMVKNGASGNSTFHIQAEGGQTEIGGNFIPKSQFTLGSSSNYWGNAYIKNLVADTLSGHLTGSLTGNVTGNASSATKLQTARKIILGNDLQGEVSFDGTKDVTFTASSYHSTIGGGNTQNYPWRRIATTGSVTGEHVDKDIVIAIRHSFNGGGYGIAKVSLRTNQGSTGAVAQCELRWLIRQNIAVDALQAGFRNTAKDAYVDLFYKVGTWPRAKVYQLQGDRSWTLISSTEANDTTTSDKKTSSEAYATIAAAATALNRTYTSTVTAVDQGYVERAYKDESGNNIKASYLAAIQQVTSDKDTFTFRGYNKNNGAMNNLITIPAATASGTDNTKWKAGLVTSQAQQWAGTKTFRDNIVISHPTTGTVAPGATNPHIRFEEYEGVQPVYLMYTDHDTYRSPAGLKVVGDSSKSSSKAWFEIEGDLIVGTKSTLGGDLTISGNIMPSKDITYTLGDNNYKWLEMHTQYGYIFETLYVNRCADGAKGGIALYSTSAPTTYGIAMRTTGNQGTHGYVTSDWATYFSMDGANTRGWIFKQAGTNVASINGQGYAQFNKISLNRVGASANGRISWYSPTYRTWYDYMENGTTAGAAPTGGQPGQLGSVTGWAMRSLIQNSATYGWVWEAATEAAAANTSTRPTALMALAADTGRLYLTNDLMFMMGDTDKFVHYLYNTTAGAAASTYVGASWRAGVLGSGSSNTNYYVIQSGTSSTANTTWENAVRIGQNNYDFTVGTTTKGGIGVANTSSSTGNGISLYGGAMPNSDGTAKSGKPTYGLFFGGTGTFGKHGGVQGDWATYFTMDSTANRGWVFLKGETAVASISNDGITKVGNNSGATAVDTGALRVYGGLSTTLASYFGADVTFKGKHLYYHGSLATNSMIRFLDNTGDSYGNGISIGGGGTVIIGAGESASEMEKLVTAAGTETTYITSDNSIEFHTNCNTITNRVSMVFDTSRNLYPNTDDTGSLGTSSKRWKYLYIGTGGSEVTGIGKFKNGAAATAINTGALQVTGGLSTTAASYMNGALTVNSTINATGNITAPRFIGLADEATAIAQVANGSGATAITGAPGTGKIRFYYNVNNGTAGLFPANNNANSIITINKHSGNYDSQLGFSSDGNIYYRSFNGSALNTTSGWQMLITTSNMFGELDGRYVNVTGDTMTGMLRVNNAPIFGYRYGQSNNAPAFVFDKPGSNYTGIGANGTSDTIYFSAVTSDGNWNWNNDYKQKWVFNGSVTADAFNGNASSATIARSLGTDESMKLYAQYTNELNFGGTNNSGTIYFGYRAADSKPIPTQFIFGGPSGSATLVAANFQGNASSASKVNILRTIGGSNHAEALKTEFNSYKASIPRNCLSTYYSTAYSNGSFYMGYFLGGYDSSPYGGFFVAHYGTPYYVGITNGSFVQSQLWKKGDAVTGAVWNDYAECRESKVQEAGYVLCETGKDDLVKTIERLQHFAGVSSDTWGFSQGETEKAKTPIAVAGRVLVYPYQDRNNYKPGDCVCAAPGGKVDIMTREEIINYPDRIVGTVSCVPEYDTWGGGENADRDPVQVNGRIWIKVR
jgi:hypothetical protein